MKGALIDMKAIFKKVFLITTIIWVVISMLYAVFITCCDIIGYGIIDEFLEWLHFPLNANQILILGSINAAIQLIVFIISYYVSKRKSGKKQE